MLFEACTRILSLCLKQLMIPSLYRIPRASCYLAGSAAGLELSSVISQVNRILWVFTGRNCHRSLPSAPTGASYTGSRLFLHCNSSSGLFFYWGQAHLYDVLQCTPSQLEPVCTDKVWQQCARLPTTMPLTCFLINLRVAVPDASGSFTALAACVSSP